MAAARAVVGGSEEYAAWMTDGADARRREKDDAGGRANDETAADAVAGDEEEAGDGAGAGAGAGGRGEASGEDGRAEADGTHDSAAAPSSILGALVRSRGGGGGAALQQPHVR